MPTVEYLSMVESQIITILPCHASLFFKQGFHTVSQSHLCILTFVSHLPLISLMI